jgi:hypothetical protein
LYLSSTYNIVCNFFKVFVIEAIKYFVDYPEYAAYIAGDDSNEFEILPGDEYEEDDEQTREEDLRRAEKRLVTTSRLLI